MGSGPRGSRDSGRLKGFGPVVSSPTLNRSLRKTKGANKGLLSPLQIEHKLRKGESERVKTEDAKVGVRSVICRKGFFDSLLSFGEELSKGGDGSRVRMGSKSH